MIGAYITGDGSWVGYDKEGRTQPVNGLKAKQLEAAREDRIQKRKEA